MGRVDDAIQALSGALSLQPHHVNASYALASCKNSKGEFKEAIRANSAACLSPHCFVQCMKASEIEIKQVCAAEDYMAALALDERQVRRGPPGHRRMASASNSPTRASTSSGLAQERAVINGHNGVREHGGATASNAREADTGRKRMERTQEHSLRGSDTDMAFLRGYSVGSSESTPAPERGEVSSLSSRTMSGARDGLSTAVPFGELSRQASSGSHASPAVRDRSAGVSTFLAQGYAHRKQVCSYVIASCMLAVQLH